MGKLIWAKPFGRRCKHRIHKADSSDYFGRCELAPHDNRTPHALERGMVIVRWQSVYSWLEGS